MSTDNQSAQSEREAFEAWALSIGFGPAAFAMKRSDGGYGAMFLESRWEGWQARSALAQAPAPSGEAPDMPAICAALGFDPTNHHNAAKCPYCSPATPPTPEQAGPSGEALTPSSHWHKAGEADPHAKHYDCERAALAMGNLTDDELANGAFMNYDRRPPPESILAGTTHSPIAWMTAVKDRIRWLSRSLERALASPGAMEGAQAAQPVAWRIKCPDGHYVYGDESPLIADGDEHRVECLYAHPPTGEST